MFRIAEFSRRGLRLSIRDGCLIADGGDAGPASLPLAELSAVLVSAPALSVTGAVLYALAEHRIPLVVCDRSAMPQGVLCHTGETGHDADAVMTAQFSQSAAAKGRQWKRIIQAKISGQSVMLRKWRRSEMPASLPGRVRNADPDNLEGAAAARYWRELGLFAHRSRRGGGANGFFNCGYTGLYAAFSREIAVAGLNPRLGIFHHCRNNPFPLASDLMEPFRPAVDDAVLRAIAETGAASLTAAAKSALLRCLYSAELAMPEGKRNLFAACRECVQSYKRMLLTGDPGQLVLPEWKAA